LLGPDHLGEVLSSNLQSLTLTDRIAVLTHSFVHSHIVIYVDLVLSHLDLFSLVELILRPATAIIKMNLKAADSLLLWGKVERTAEERVLALRVEEACIAQAGSKGLAVLFVERVPSLFFVRVVITKSLRVFVADVVRLIHLMRMGALIIFLIYLLHVDIWSLTLVNNCSCTWSLEELRAAILL
jgi:hypothetical protein